jgi:hypothetical protein
MRRLTAPGLPASCVAPELLHATHLCYSSGACNIFSGQHEKSGKTYKTLYNMIYDDAREEQEQENRIWKNMKSCRRAYLLDQYK